VPDEPLPPPKSPPPAGPYREPWKTAETATHIDQFERAADLQEHLLKLRAEVDAGKHDARSADELSGLIAKLTRARENLRRFVRYRVGGPRWALGVIGSFGAISALYTMLKGMPLHERPELLVFAIVAAASVAVACVVLLTSALRWGDCLPEYDGLIADLRKLSEARRKDAAVVTKVQVAAAVAPTDAPAARTERPTRPASDVRQLDQLVLQAEKQDDPELTREVLAQVNEWHRRISEVGESPEQKNFFEAVARINAFRRRNSAPPSESSRAPGVSRVRVAPETQATRAPAPDAKEDSVHNPADVRKRGES